MAGAGYKLFNTGDVLTAAQVNTYLMEQTVMVFASSTARTTALSGVLAEGMISYLQDTNAVQVYNGSAWVNVGEAGDITEVIAGTGISGGGTSGAVTVTNSMATAINAKGDLIAGTADNAFDRLAAGSNGDTLVADSSTSTGLRYNPQNALANPVINGGMDIWQRGTTFSNANVNTYTADRWTYGRGSNATGQTVSRQTVSDSTNLPNIQYSMRSQRQSGNTGTQSCYVMQTVETVNCIPFAGKTVTFSYYARAGANYSATSNLMNVYFATGTGTDQSLWSGFTGQTVMFDTNVTLTTTWQRFVHTFTIGSTATQFGFYFVENPTGTASTNDWFEVTGVQIDLGTYTASSAPTFRRSGGTLAGELAACQRYFQRIGSESPNSVFSYYGIGFAASTTNVITSIPLKVVMRTAPSMSYLAAGEYNHYGIVPTAIATDTSANHTIAVITTSSGLTLRGAYPLYADNTNSSYIDISAEL